MLRQGKGINFFLIESQLDLTRADSAESEVYEHPNFATAKITINFYKIKKSGNYFEIWKTEKSAENNMHN